MLKGELNKKSKFSEIKKFYKENEDILPFTLDSECIYYSDIKKTVEIYIFQVESEVKRLGVENIKKSAVAKSGKRNLYTMYLNLLNFDLWNAPRPKMNLLNQRL